MLEAFQETRASVYAHMEALVMAHPLHSVLRSIPAAGIGTAAPILTEVVGKDFAAAGHSASCSSPAPVT